MNTTMHTFRRYNIIVYDEMDFYFVPKILSDFRDNYPERK